MCRHRASTQPHDGWAQYYDAVMEESFGVDLHELTSRSLATIRQALSPPACVVDYGAGTGRLAIPLARLGFDVTAVDPAPAMLSRIVDKAPELPIRRTDATMASFRSEPRFDLALCVFSVVAHILDHAALAASCNAVASVLRPGGELLIDVPHASLFQSCDIETDHLIRCVEVQPVDGVMYRYQERGVLRRESETWNYEDIHTLRCWSREELTQALTSAGFVFVEDYSAQFTRWGADYLRLRLSETGPSPRVPGIGLKE